MLISKGNIPASSAQCSPARQIIAVIFGGKKKLNLSSLWDGKSLTIANKCTSRDQPTKNKKVNSDGFFMIITN